MRLSVVVVLAATAAILASASAAPPIDNRLRSVDGLRNLKKRDKKDLSADTLTDEEERGLFSWMLFQGGKSSKKLEKLASMEKYGPPRVNKPLRVESLPDGRKMVISEKMYQAKLAKEKLDKAKMFTN